MHDTARCLGYPSDSSRAARERAQEATCSRHLRWTGQEQPGWAPPPLVIAASPPLPSPLRLNSSSVWLNPSLLARVAQLFASVVQLFAPGPCASALLPCGSPLSHLAGVGQCPLAIGYGYHCGCALSIYNPKTFYSYLLAVSASLRARHIPVGHSRTALAGFHIYNWISYWINELSAGISHGHVWISIHIPTYR
jgi:hypothetical protein